MNYVVMNLSVKSILDQNIGGLMISAKAYDDHVPMSTIERDLIESIIAHCELHKQILIKPIDAEIYTITPNLKKNSQGHWISELRALVLPLRSKTIFL